MPVANLQSYQTVALRVHSSAFASKGIVLSLEKAVTQRLRAQCGFSSVGRPGATPADVVLDLNVTNIKRGGGMISNPNQANVDTLLVLSEGGTRELIGTARIHGQSSGMIVNNSVPELEAMGAIAQSIGDLLAKSGCSGPRVARVEPPPPPPPGPGSAGSATDPGSAAPPPPTPDESHRAEAEALNDQGKEKLQAADMPGAYALFQKANALLPDARYEFNMCLALEAQEQWDGAIAACRQAKAMNPEARLVTKIDHRLDLLQHHQ